MSTGTGASDLLHAEDTAIDQIVSGKSPVAARSPMQLFWRRFKKDKVALGAGTFIVVLIVLRDLRRADPQARRRAAAEPAADDRARQLRPPAPGPSSKHIFGVDQIGRDVFSRTLAGARVSLIVAFVGTGLSVTVRRDAGHGRRLLPRLDRHADLALGRHPARVPGAAARPRPRVGVLGQGRLPRRQPPARASAS